jgi:hypothetical protein
VLRPLALLPLLLLAACSSSSGAHAAKDSFTQPSPSAFRAGPCSAAAHAVLRVGQDAHSLVTGTAPDAAISDHLKADQDVVDALQAGIEPGLKPAFSQLVISIGVVRLRIDSNTFAVPVAQELSTAYDAAVAACTPTATATPSP